MSEAIAVGSFGADWADYVIDVPPTLISHFVKGSDISSVISIDQTELKRRDALSLSL